MNVNEVLSKDYLNKMSFEKTKPHKDSLAVKTLRLRLKNKHASYLNQLAMEVNQVRRSRMPQAFRNFCNAHGMKVYERERRFWGRTWPSANILEGFFQEQGRNPVPLGMGGCQYLKVLYIDFQKFNQGEH